MWNDKPPAIYALWERNWENIITIFTYLLEVRRVIYTTNVIEVLNGVIRSRLNTKRILGSDESTLKLVWVAVSNASQKWKMPISNWSKALSHYFYIRYVVRFTKLA
ncbi:MAG: transposase [Synergistaceae bacterium]|nr:transposase [Synergistaceae bacterium]